MEKQAIDIDKFHRLRIAAGFDADRTYPSLFSLLGYRKRVAEELVYRQSEELSEVYSYTNDQIKQILGL